MFLLFWMHWKKRSFAAASAKLYKTPSALSYTVQKLESDLNIQILDRSGHRARFTRTGQMLLEKGVKSSIPFVNSKNRPSNCIRDGKRAGDWGG
jgi:hypothetical protein